MRNNDEIYYENEKIDEKMSNRLRKSWKEKLMLSKFLNEFLR